MSLHYHVLHGPMEICLDLLPPAPLPPGQNPGRTAQACATQGSTHRVFAKNQRLCPIFLGEQDHQRCSDLSLSDLQPEAHQSLISFSSTLRACVAESISNSGAHLLKSGERFNNERLILLQGYLPPQLVICGGVTRIIDSGLEGPRLASADLGVSCKAASHESPNCCFFLWKGGAACFARIGTFARIM